MKGEPLFCSRKLSQFLSSSDPFVVVDDDDDSDNDDHGDNDDDVCLKDPLKMQMLV